MSKEKWVLYILECKDNTLYTGITNDLEKRLKAHRSGNGAKYTRGRFPIKLCYTEACDDKSHALRREIEIKRLPKMKKLLLCNGYLDDGGE